MVWRCQLTTKTIGAVVLATGLLFATAGVATPPANPIVRIGIDGSFSPLSSKTGDGYHGIDIDISALLATALKHKLEFTAGTEEQLRTKLFAGDLDIVIAATLATFGDRHDFHVIHYLNLPAVWIRSTKTKHQAPIQVVGTLSFQLLREHFELSKSDYHFSKVRGYEHLDTILLSLDRNEVDAIPMDEIHATQLQAKESKRLRIEHQSELGIPVYAMIRKGSGAIGDRLKSELEKLVKRGETQRICQKWFKKSCPSVLNKQLPKTASITKE